MINCFDWYPVGTKPTLETSCPNSVMASTTYLTVVPDPIPTNRGSSGKWFLTASLAADSFAASISLDMLDLRRIEEEWKRDLEVGRQSLLLRQLYTSADFVGISRG